MRILLIGRNGQVGHELEPALAAAHDLVALDRKALDLCDPDAIARTVDAVQPEVIVNAAAYTAVDRAQSEPELAFRINAHALEAIGKVAKKRDALVVHFSTDYVFDGEKQGPYTEDDVPHPISIYGESKLAGERALADTGCRHLILRTSWVYESRGRNFLRAILRLAGEKSELRVVGDQIGSPTAARDLAGATARLLAREALPAGIYHLSAAGHASWFDFAREILACTGNRHVRVVEIPSSEYPAAARRPRNSLLSNEKIRAACGIELPEWRDAVARVCRDLG